MNKLPLVTIISPCYNHSKFVIESLESIKNQSYPNIEHIIIDDCSSDDSVKKIEDWITANEYKCVFIKHKMNMGISYTLNKSLKTSKGKYWAGLSTDDIAGHDRIEKFVNYLENNPT
jgi:glycosyltransferase involved in cell wall biosynthesis